MYKTVQDIEDDFYNAIKQTSIVSSVSGELYKQGLRPVNSKLEDINLIVTTLDSEQYQNGIITLLVFCNGVDLYQSQTVPDKARIKEVSSKLLLITDELKNLMPEYDGFYFAQGITNDWDVETEQYFVSAKIGFKYLTI